MVSGLMRLFCSWTVAPDPLCSSRSRKEYRSRGGCFSEIRSSDRVRLMGAVSERNCSPMLPMTEFGPTRWPSSSRAAEPPAVASIEPIRRHRRGGGAGSG